MTGRVLLSLLFLCQGLLFISAAYIEEIEDGVKVEETDWVDISAYLTANVDDNTPDNSQGIDEDEAMLEDLQLTNDADDMGTKFDDDSITSNNEDSYPIEDVSTNRLCRNVSLSAPFLNRAVCRIGVPAFVKVANKMSIPNIRKWGFRLYRSGISRTKVGSCSITGAGSRKTVSISNMQTQFYARYSYKKGWFKIGGSVLARVTGVSVRLSFSDSAQPNGCKALSNLKCNSSIQSVKIKVRGRIVGWIIKLFQRKIGRVLKSLLNRQFCNLAKKVMMRKLF